MERPLPGDRKILLCRYIGPQKTVAPVAGSNNYYWKRDREMGYCVTCS